MGVRYDLDHGAQGEWVSSSRGCQAVGRPSGTTSRPGSDFAYAANERTVVRGGYGLFFTELEDDALAPVAHAHRAHDDHDPQRRAARTSRFQPVQRPEADATSRCSPGRATSRTCRQLAEIVSRARSATGPKSRSARTTRRTATWRRFGVQRQLGALMSLESNFVFTGGRKEERRRNINQFHQPGDRSELSHRPRTLRASRSRSGAPLRAEIMNGRSNYYGWENTFTKRFSRPLAGQRHLHAVRVLRIRPGFSAPTSPYVVPSIRRRTSAR